MRAVILRLGAVVLLDCNALPDGEILPCGLLLCWLNGAQTKEPHVLVACLDFHLHTPWKDIPDWDLCFLDCVVLTLVLADCAHCNAHHVVQRETIIMPALIRLTRQGVGLQ